MIRAESLTKNYGKITALEKFSMEIGKGEFFGILGPSGCGKTTLLRLIAGLEKPDSGRLFVNDNEITHTPPQERPVNTVFQSYALFPHLNVRRNIEFGLRMSGAREVPQKVGEISEIVQISDLEDRYPSELSGGQKQRVALARALVNQPSVLLLDEPLSALDARLRRELQVELKSLQRRLGMTFVFVTHDQDEALSLSDRIAVLNHGQLVQCGKPSELYERPRDEFTARFLGACNVLPVTAEGPGLKFAWGVLQCELPQATKLVGIRPEKIQIAKDTGSNVFAAEVKSITYTGPSIELVVMRNGFPMRVTLPSSNRCHEGDQLNLHLPIEALIPLEL